MEQYRVKLTFTEPILGTIPKDHEVYATWVAERAALTDEAIAEELETVESREEKGWTGFHVENGTPVLYDYVIRGFFKSACYQMRLVTGSASSKLTAYKKKIDGQAFIFPRRIPLTLPEGTEMGTLERPLRADTAQGPRVTLARSDTCPAGTMMEFEIHILGHPITARLLHEWLDYGQYMGLGQWRSGGYGRFSYEMEKL